ncbi:hypothetical protein FCL47_19020 [Desulfopila sp. IMCC35006]|uniref:COG4705 family protein n=1 Tax=Desulfopila sp. IMCC35006 TaxID=2569542 RepID=UPI0010AD2B49|nr:hypothetical protein [Desulfopila sp. IMCC35006]TKB24278.1 hypothetical protein FCL47_19020 [Desulfopila sp. IMCC35006]
MNPIEREDALAVLNKVPEVTIWFWIIKIMATTVGETAADFLNVRLHFGLSGTSLVMGVLLAFFLVMQVREQKYVPWLYWATVVLISIVGTLITDNLVDNLGISLQTTSFVFGLALAATFFGWYRLERTLSIHTIYTRRRELFYWAAILFTFALGTAAGDLVAEGLNLGYATAGLGFGCIISAVTVAHLVFKANGVTTFWIAYILTRPLGASLGDFLSQPGNVGGLGLGTTSTSVLFLTTIFTLVFYMTSAQKKVMVKDRS